MIITRQKVKTLLQIDESDTSKDVTIDAYIPVIQNFIVDKCNNRFHHGDVSISGDTISFLSSEPGTITDSTDGFLDANFPESNIDIDVGGSYRNDGIYAVDSTTDGVMTLKAGEELITESEEAGVVITLVNFPEGIHSTVSDMILFKMDKNRALKSWGIADYRESMAGEGGYPKALLAELRNYVKLKWG